MKNLDTVHAENEEEQDSVIDCDSMDISSVSNRFTILEEQHLKDSTLDEEKTSDIDQEGKEDTQLVSEMEKVTLDDSFIESDAVEQVMESEDEPLEDKEYIVVNQDPELAFHTLATRLSPEKQDCSVQSCLFQFTEVETLTQNNSLLCVACTKQQQNKDKAGGILNPSRIKNFYPFVIALLTLILYKVNTVVNFMSHFLVWDQSSLSLNLSFLQDPRRMSTLMP